MKEKIAISSIADLLNVSPVTVSRALSDKSGVRITNPDVSY